MKEEIKLFQERIEKEGFTVWLDDICLPKTIGQDYKLKLVEGIKSSKIFLCISNKGYIKSPNCTKEFNYAVSNKKPLIIIELEKIENELMLFDLGNNFTHKVYKIKKDCRLSDIPEEHFIILIESIQHLLKKN